jgi:protein-S-isoprenylcysteine O-methyltransferase Ste14
VCQVTPGSSNRRRLLAATASAGWFAVTAWVGVVWVPWRLTGWQVTYQTSTWRGAQLLGVALVVAGLVTAVSTFVSFVGAGGTPIPGALTDDLVVRGLNRFVRNPIYLGVLAIIIGEAMVLGQWSLLVYAMVVWLVAAWFVRVYEEPALLRRFGPEYESYRNSVPAWRPRLHPWHGPLRTP